MLRRALLLSVALTGILACTHASAAQTTIPVRGDVKAIAIAGDALIVARQPPNRGLAVERLTPGAAQTLLRMPRSRDDSQVVLAASPQALAVAVQADTTAGYSASYIFVGPPGGPLRDVATCAAGLLLPPVAVSASSIAWSEGGCGEPLGDPRDVSPAAIVVGGADPAAPLRRVPVGPDALPAAIALDGERGLVGLLRPSFFLLNSEVRRFGAAELGETLATEDGRIVAPIGVLRDGEAIVGRAALAEGDAEASSTRCGSMLFAIAPGAIQRRALPLDGCPIDDDFPRVGTGTRIAGDRVYSIVAQSAPSKRDVPPPVALKSVRGDGGEQRVHARGSHRPPRGLAVAEPGRIAWWQRRCAGGSEIVIDDGVAPATDPSIPSCSVELLDRSARVRGGRITLGLRCPVGCSGQAIGETRRLPRFLRSFSFGRGRHALRLRLTRSERRASRLRVTLEVADGPPRAALIRLR